MARTPSTVRTIRYRTFGSDTKLLDEIPLPMGLYYGGRLGRFAIRHWRGTCALLAVWFLWGYTGTFAGSLLLVGGGWGLTAWLLWRRRSASGSSSVLEAVVGSRQKATLLKQWPLACETANLTGPRRNNPPALRQVHAAGDGTVTATVASGKIGVPVFSIAKQVGTLAEVIGCREVVVTETGPGCAKLAFHWRDPVERHLALADLPLTTSAGTLAYGIRQDGDLATVRSDQSILIGGLTRHGKSNTVWCLLADCIRQQIPVRLAVSDPKGGVELDAFESMVGQSGGLVEVREYAQTATETTKMLERVEKAMAARQHWMKEHKVRKIIPDAENPLVIVILDETLPLTELLKKGQDSPLGRIAYTGSAAGYVVWANSQVGQVDAIGRFRDFIPQRICFATPNPQVTDSILGGGAESAGARCSEIRSPGIGYSFVEGQHTPRKFRAAEVTDDATKLIAQGRLPAAVMEMAQMSRVEASGETALYRHFSGEERLLYVGITNNYARRAGEHSDDKPWWTQVRRSTVEMFPSRKAAEVAEKRAIEREHPQYNDIYNGRPRVPRRKVDLRVDKRLSTRRAA